MGKAPTIIVIILALAGAAFGEMGDVVGSFPLPECIGQCGGLGRSDNYLYFLEIDLEYANIYRMNPITGRVYNHYPGPGGYTTRGLAYGSGYLYTLNTFYPHVLYKMAEATGSIVATFGGIPTDTTASLAPRATGDGGAGMNALFMGDSVYNNRRIYAYDFNGSLSSFNIPEVVRVENFAYDWRNNIIWCANNYLSKDVVFHGITTTGSVVTSFAAPVRPCHGLAYYGEYLWAQSNQGSVFWIHCPGPEPQFRGASAAIAPSSLGRVKAVYK